MSSSAAIGVFDSGLGGLTVLAELHRALPDEHFIYLGDVARLPYGTKSKDVVTRYAQTCVEFLVGKGVKQVIVACNTASALALPTLQAQCSVDILGVIEAGVAAGVSATRGGQVLVLATESTVKSEAYLKEFGRQNPQIRVEQLACPLLVPFAEEGWFDSVLTAQVIQTYLGKASPFDFDTLVLGCTHYPLLQPSFERVVGRSVALVHGAVPLALQVREGLEGRGQFASPRAGGGSLEFFSTDSVSQSLPILSRLFPGRTAQFDLVDL